VQKTKERIFEIINEMVVINKNRTLSRKNVVVEDRFIDNELQKSFPYVETLDQKQAISDVYKDMSSPGLMDRIIIGDVGFGKTEVAIRAAVRSVCSGGFVIVVVPTTILADQHYISFKGRLESLGINVRMISRFISKNSKKKVCDEIVDKTVDILIGTHAVLSDVIPKKRLSLIIIDEEHKFGVSHKNKLLKIRQGLDVLTLSATPIPRTLQQSLLGIRDVTLIQTPPINRLPIKTRVLYKKWSYLKKLVERELFRNGQVYFVHNKINSINSIKELIQKIIPEVRIGVGHGQLPEHQLEEVMGKFISRELDVLLCTTIIESGLDIPTANTIIINRADHFGLTQLYQLRGRVGRFKHQAYAYLLIPGVLSIRSDARERLSAIEELSEPPTGNLRPTRSILQLHSIFP
jgi:transcription-repair coupling factor (superfamily II helicase)